MSRLASDGVLGGAILIPNTAGLLVVTADLRANQVTCYVDIDAPHEGRPATRVNWLIRQLRSAPDSLRVEAFAIHARGAGTAELLKDIRESPALLIADPTKELRMFRVAVSTPMGTKRGRGRGSFIDSVADSINRFYSQVMQSLKAWTATSPKMRELPPMPEERPALASTALSSQDGVEVPDPIEPATSTGVEVETTEAGVGDAPLALASRTDRS